MALLNECYFLAASSGTGAFVVSAPIIGFFTPALCTSPPAIDGALYRYRAESADLSEHEIGEGIYTAGTATLTRVRILQSSNAGAVVNFTAAPRVRVEALVQTFRDCEYSVLAMQLALQVADNTNLALILGSAGDLIADAFDALTYVDVAGATNLDSATSGVLKPSLGSGTTQASAATTGSAVAPATGYTIIDRGFALTNGVIVSSVGIYSTVAATGKIKIVNEDSTTQYDILVNQAFTHAGGGWQDFTLASPFTVPASGTIRMGAVIATGGPVGSVSPAGNRSYKNGDITGNDQSGFTADGPVGTSYYPVRATHSVTLNNLTVSTSPFTAAAAPAMMKALVRVKEVDAAVAGTDYTLEGTRDGTTWAAMALTELFTSASPIAGMRYVMASETDVSGQPSGTSPQLRFKTLTNKMVEWRGHVVNWS